MIKPLEYYFAKKIVLEHVIFNKYTIDENGVIKNKKSGKLMTYHETKKKYSICWVYDDDGNRRGIQVGRALASTFNGPPSTLEYTADHIDKKRDKNTYSNIRWNDVLGQNINQDRPTTFKSAFIILKDEIEMTVNDWMKHLKSEKNSFGREYTNVMIKHYAQKKQHGFSYKEYPDLPGEVWKEIVGSVTKTGRWEISNMNRVKYITKYAENVLSGEQLGVDNGYPVITYGLCHILVFKTFFPEKWAMKKSVEIVLHEDDDRLDFRPHKLRLGTRKDNGNDAHKNGCYDGTKSAMVRCASYIVDVFEKEHDSQNDAARYLISIGFEKASPGNISNVLCGDRETAYGRTWKRI